MFQMFEIAVSFSLGKGEEDSTKSRVNYFRGKHGNESAKTVKMESRDNMPRQLSKVHAKRDVRIL